MTDAPPAPVAQAFDAMPDDVRARLMKIRALIFAAAGATGTGPLTETLKWGQPAYLTEKTKAGTTIRLGWKASDPDRCALLVHCQSDLVGRWRQLFPDEFAYDGNRAVLVPVRGPVAGAALQQIAGMALTYHRDRRARRR